MRKEDLEVYKDAFIAFEKENEKAKRTLIHYDHAIDVFIDSIESEELMKSDVVEFKERIKDKFAPSTVSNYITVVNKFLKYALITEAGYPPEFCKNSDYLDLVKDGKIKNLTVKNIKMQQRSSLVEMLEPSEYKRLRNHAKKTGRMKLYLIMKIFAHTGIRVGELKCFTFEAVKDGFYIKLDNKGKIRDAILPQDLRRELLKYCKDEKITSGYIFRGRKEGEMIHSSTIWKQLKDLAGECKGISKSKVHAHSFRHLFCLKCIEDGMSLAEVADIAGHSNVETTRIYLRTTNKEKRKKLEKLKY